MGHIDPRRFVKDLHVGEMVNQQSALKVLFALPEDLHWFGYI